MKKINKLKPVSGVIFDNELEQLILTKGMSIIITTDNTEHELMLSGDITFVNEDGVVLDDNEDIIFWEYIKEIDVV